MLPMVVQGYLTQKQTPTRRRKRGGDSHQVPGDDLGRGEEDQDCRDQRGVVEVLPDLGFSVWGRFRVSKFWV